MKQETRDAAEKGLVAVLGSAATWSLADVNQVIALMVGIATFIFIVVQLFFLCRKWYILEINNWKIKQTDHGDLGEH